MTATREVTFRELIATRNVVIVLASEGVFLSLSPSQAEWISSVITSTVGSYTRRPVTPGERRLHVDILDDGSAALSEASEFCINEVKLPRSTAEQWQTAARKARALAQEAKDGAA